LGSGLGLVVAAIVILSPWSGVDPAERSGFRVVYLSAQVLLTLGVVAGSWRMRSRGRRAWTVVAAAAVLSVCDDLAWALLAGPVGYGVVGAGLAARVVVQAAGGVFVLSFPVLLLRARLGGRSDREGFVDGLAIACAIGLVLWETLVRLPGADGLIGDANVALFMLLTGVLSAVVALLVRLGFTGLHHEPAARLLLVAAVVHAAAIVLLGAAGAPQPGVAWPAELLAMVSFCLLAAAAWHPSAGRLAVPIDIEALGVRASLTRLATLAVALVVPGVATSLRMWWSVQRASGAGTATQPEALLAPAVVLPSSVAALVITVSVIWRMWQLVQDRERARDLLRHRATHDDLTGLPNRRVLHDLLIDNLTAHGAQGRAAQLVVLFMDLDGFKAVNDTLGHQAGDRVLVAVSVRIREALRDDDTLVRIAGDEFVAVCSGPLDEATARAIAGRVHARIVKPIDVNGLDVTVSASIGIALSPPSTGDATRDALGILRLADHAMYDAKRAGGSRTVVVEAADV
jgi:diguanylate cyclase (GGDEF)-like protein